MGLRIAARVREAKLVLAREMTLFRAAANPRQLSHRHKIFKGSATFIKRFRRNPSTKVAVSCMGESFTQVGLRFLFL